MRGFSFLNPEPTIMYGVLLENMSAYVPFFSGKTLKPVM